MSLLSPIEWENFLSNFPDAHILQTKPWGELKQAFGWKVAHLGVTSADSLHSIGAQILIKPLPFGLSLAYIARGPVGLNQQPDKNPLWKKWLAEVDHLCQKQRVVFLKIEPDLWRDNDEKNLSSLKEQVPAGFLSSQQDIQPSRTLMVDLSGDEDDVLARMKQKTRYNVRLASKKGVIVKQSQDLTTFYRLMSLTAQRDQFGVHSLAYYQKAFDLFNSKGACQIFIAEYQGEPLAAIMVFYHGKRAWYFYGASANEHRDRMPAYLVQWEAIRWAKAQGCSQYDLWGVPDDDLQSLEDNFMNRSTGLWGVYRFKRGFGGELMRTQGPWDRVYKPFWYSLYHTWLKIKEGDNEA